MDVVVKLVDGFTGIFKAGGENLVGLIVGILPTLAVLLITINALISFIGEEKVERVALKFGEYSIFRYVILPFLGAFTMPNPGGLTLGKFLKEEYKTAYGDASSAMSHPLTSIFPHVNPGELFVWIGVSQGIEKLGLSTGELAIRYVIVGLILAYCRGMVTEKIYKFMKNRKTQEGLVNE